MNNSKLKEFQNTTSNTWIKRNKWLKNYISERREKQDKSGRENVYFHDKCQIIGKTENIVKSLGGSFRNLTQSFFKLDKIACEGCGKRKETGEIKQLQRAHDPKINRPVIATRAIDKLKKEIGDANLPIPISKIMIGYIEEHKSTVLWMLCNSCHNLLDNKKKKK